MCNSTWFPISIRLALLATAFCALPTRGGQIAELVRAFQDNPAYVAPFATLYGSMSNSGWYQSAAVPKGFGLYLGFPMNITRISDEDRSFKATYVDSVCMNYRATSPPSTCREVTKFTTPTIFGGDHAPIVLTSNLDTNGQIVDTQKDTVGISDGLKSFLVYNWFPFGAPQFGISWKYTEVKLRYIGLPLSTFSFSMPGIGIQHDFASFLPRFLPKLPINISAAANFTWLSGELKPGGDVSGTMELTGFSHFLGLLVGYTYGGWAEAFLEAGWEGASLHGKGDMIIDPTSASPENISVDMTLDGRNTFRAALNVAIHFGYDAVLGQNFGSEFGNQLNLLGFKLK